jgi:hypothetical protein
MKKLLLCILLIFLPGCANFNPREDIKNRGKIDEIKNNQNGLMNEMGNLKQQSEIQNSQLKDLQQGFFNLNNTLSRNDNSGIQILQGDGALVLIFGIVVVGMILFHYRDRALKSEKAANIIAKEVARINDPYLNDNILKAAMNSSAESHVYNLLSTKVAELNRNDSTKKS